MPIFCGQRESAADVCSPSLSIFREAAARAALAASLDESLSRFEARIAQAVRPAPRPAVGWCPYLSLCFSCDVMVTGSLCSQVADRIRADLGLGGPLSPSAVGSKPLALPPIPAQGAAGSEPYPVEFVTASDVAMRIAASRAPSCSPVGQPQQPAVGGAASAPGGAPGAGAAGTPGPLAPPVFSAGGAWGQELRDVDHAGGAFAEAAAQQPQGTADTAAERKRRRDAGEGADNAAATAAPQTDAAAPAGSPAAAQKRTRAAAAAPGPLPPLYEDRAEEHPHELRVHNYHTPSPAVAVVVVDSPASSAGAKGRAGDLAAGHKRRRSAAGLVEADTQSEQSEQLAPPKRRELGTRSAAGRGGTGA